MRNKQRQSLKVNRIYWQAQKALVCNSSEDGSQQFLTPKPAELEEEAESERAESESPVPPEVPDVGRDDSQLLYSTVPQDYVDKKR